MVSQKSGKSQKFLEKYFLTDNTNITDVKGYFSLFSALSAYSARKNSQKNVSRRNQENRRSFLRNIFSRITQISQMQKDIFLFLFCVMYEKKQLEKWSRRNRGNRRSFLRNNCLTDNTNITDVKGYFSLFSALSAYSG